MGEAVRTRTSFSAPRDIWAMTEDERKALQPGQWVYAGDRSARGQFLGVKPSGSVVVAWQSNARAQANPNAYRRALRDYAMGT